LQHHIKIDEITCKRIGSASRSKEKRNGGGEVVEAKMQSNVAGMADGGIRRKLDMSEVA